MIRGYRESPEGSRKKMKINNRFLSVLFKTLISTVAVWGILIQCGAFEGVIRWSVFNYYTLLSNVLCALYFAAAAIREKIGRDTLLPSLKGAVVLAIAVTGLVYHFMLSGSFEMQGTMAVSNILLHYVVPVMAVTDWLLFDTKGRYSWKHPLFWVLPPVVYFLWAAVRVAGGATLGYGGNRYPYPFLDADTLGWGRVMINVSVLLLFFIVLGYVFYAIDRVLAHCARKTIENAANKQMLKKETED